MRQLFQSCSRHGNRLFRDDSGVTAIEYGLITAAIGFMLVAVFPQISAPLKNIFTQIKDFFASAVA